MVRCLSVLATILLASIRPLLAQGGATSGSVHSVDAAPVEGVRVYAACGGVRDSAVVDSAGRFELTAPCTAGAALELVDDVGGRYLPSIPHVRPRRGGGEPAFLLIPRLWTIASGTHAGSVVPVDLPGANERACRGCAAFYSAEDTVLMNPPGIPVWLEHSLPLRLAFSGEDGVAITEQDSIAFMRVAESLEMDLGRRWFKAATESEIFDDPAAEQLGSILVSIDPGLRTAGRGNWAAQGGEIVAGVIYLKSTALIRDPRSSGIVAHELMHALGFGHTCSWRSVVAAERCSSRRADAPTADDVAHAQLLLRLRTLERHYGIHGTVAATISGIAKHPPGPPPAPPAPPDLPPPAPLPLEPPASP